MKNCHLRSSIFVSLIAAAAAFSAPSRALADGLFIASDSVSAQSAKPVEGVIRSRNVTIDAQRLPSASDGTSTQSVNAPRKLDLNLFNDLNLSAVVAPESGHLPFQAMTVQSAENDIRTSSGFIEGDQFSTVTLSRRGGDLYGSVFADGRRFRILPLGNGQHKIEELDTSRIRRAIDDVLPPSPDSVDIQAAVKPRPNEPADIMILYSDGAVAALKKAMGTSAIDPVVLATLRTASMNRAYALSGITSDGRKAFRLVHSAKIRWTQKDATKTLKGLARPRSADARTVASLREKFGADLVVLVIDNPHPGRKLRPGFKLCGRVAAIPKLRQALPNKGFTVVDAECSVLTDTVAHEVGHLMGAQHDPDAHGPRARITGPNRGYIDYAKKYRTIMSYSTGCRARKLKCREIPVFSNPEITLVNKKGNFKWKPGQPQNHNAARIKANLPYVAAYRPRADAKPPVRRRSPAPPIKQPPSPKPAPPVSKAPTPPKVDPGQPRAPVRPCTPVRPPALTPPAPKPSPTPTPTKQPDWQPL